jgi:RNA polymerase sigma-70 factor (ECF subfamily)
MGDGTTPPGAASEPNAWAGLMARAQAGDGVAYRALLVAITPHARAIAARALRERADVEDAVQDILITVHRIRHTYDPARPFRPWLIAIARHRVLDRLRAQGRRAVWEIGWSVEAETFPADAANNAGMAWDSQELRAAMATLPDGQRQAIEMTKLREMSLLEASVASGMTVGALKVAVHRGIARLRVLLGGTR